MIPLLSTRCSDGEDGKDGRDGKDGINGINGINGKDGEISLFTFLELKDHFGMVMRFFFEIKGTCRPLMLE